MILGFLTSLDFFGAMNSSSRVYLYLSPIRIVENNKKREITNKCSVGSTEHIDGAGVTLMG